MNVFVLSTGRCGSTTFAKACGFIDNYTAGHETRSQAIGLERLNYPNRHIEVDNRLSWMLGSLEKTYGNGAYYVHLKRERLATANSFYGRWNRNQSIIRHYAEGILMLERDKDLDAKKWDCCLDYYDRVNDNIEYFLKDKTRVLTIDVAHWQESFPLFWQEIGAQGDLESALGELETIHNGTEEVQVEQSTQRKKGIRTYLKYWLGT